MGRINNIKTRIYLAVKLLFDNSNVQLRIMSCQKCGGLLFDTIGIYANTEYYYCAKYRCKKCGNEIIDSQKVKACNSKPPKNGNVGQKD